MNILVASSRGGGLARRITKHQVKCRVTSGGKISELTKEAVTLIPPVHRYRLKTHVYIMAGLPDITVKTKSTHQGEIYTEVTYTEDIQDTVNRVTNEIKIGEEKIKEAGATPIFCTITSCSIESYNQHLLTSGSTKHLLHQNSYKEMQSNLESAIKEVNAFIISTNNANNISTPYCHSVIHRRRGAKKNYFKWVYENLWDGVHGTDNTKEGWANCISCAIKANRTEDTSESDECKSPKRSWQQEKRIKLSL